MEMQDMRDLQEKYVHWMDEFLTTEEKVELLTSYLKSLRSRERGAEQMIKALQENN